MSFEPAARGRGHAPTSCRRRGRAVEATPLRTSLWLLGRRSRVYTAQERSVTFGHAQLVLSFTFFCCHFSHSRCPHQVQPERAFLCGAPHAPPTRGPERLARERRARKAVAARRQPTPERSDARFDLMPCCPPERRARGRCDDHMQYWSPHLQRGFGRQYQIEL